MSGEAKAPKHLRPKTRAWFAQVVRDYALEPHHVRLLTLAGEAWDRSEVARQAIAEHGMTYTDRFGSPKARPEVEIKRQAEITFARLLRELCLDIEPPKDAPRSPGLY